MARRDSLIAHVETDLALKIKRAAETAGVTASSYIGKLLAEHVEGQSTHSIGTVYERGNAGVLAAQDVSVDDIIVADPVIGMERVMQHRKISTKSHGDVIWMQLERHLPRTGKKISRFAFRGWAEPCITVKV